MHKQTLDSMPNSSRTNSIIISPHFANQHNVKIIVEINSLLF